MTLKHGDVEMKTLTLEVAALKDVKRRARDAFKAKKQGTRISFATPELLFNLMTAKRWELIRMMTGAGPLTTLAPFPQTSAVETIQIKPSLGALVLAGDSGGQGLGS